MFLKKIEIVNFRNYDDLNVKFNKKTNIIYGKNGQGKTNLLEAIYILGLTKSHRFFIDNNLIKENRKACKIKGILNKNKIDYKFEIELTDKIKIIKIDSKEIKKISDYVSKMNVIIFYPEDLDLIKASPNIRRKFLNLEISQINPSYLTILSDYQKILKMRNEYLKQENKEEESYYEVLETYYVARAIEIYKIRNKFINRLNEYIEQIYYNISGIKGFNIKYEPNININEYDTETIRKAIKHNIYKLKKKELNLGVSLVGPHRDDLGFYIGDKNLKSYGSQGQQRLAIISLKLAEVQLFKQYIGDTPILLLDDVFSELDTKKKNLLLKYIDSHIQTMITTTDLRTINKKIVANSKIIKISDGKIEKEVDNGGK